MNRSWKSAGSSLVLTHVPLLLAMVVGGITASAQTTAAILGTVKDQSGAVLPGAEVTATNTETGIARVTAAGTRGEYRLSAMAVGSYSVQATMTGFQSEIRSGITLSIGREAVVDFTLAVGNVAEQVTVTGEAPLIETTTATVSGLIDPKQMREIPLNARSFIELVPLQAGAVYSESGERSASKGFGVKVSISGARYNGNAFLLDGANINDMAGSAGSAAGTLAGVETVREFKIITNAFDAEYGNHVGGIVSAVTKSGTNSLHGSLFEFFRNDKLDAPDFDDNRLTGGKKPPYRRNQFGGALGGPLVRDSIFFFGSFEALRESLGEAGEYQVPGPELRQGCVPTVDNSTRARSGYNCYNAAGTPVNVPLNGVLNGVVNPRTRPFMDFYPVANTPCSASCFSGNPFWSANGTGIFARSDSIITNQNFITGRGDMRLSDSDSFFFRYTQDIADSTNPNFETAEVSSTHNRYITLEATHIFSPTLLARTHFSFVRTPMGLKDVSLKSLDLADYELLACASCTGHTNSFTGNDVPGAITITSNPISATGGDSTNPKVHNLNTFQFQEGFTYSLGRQNLKFGGSFQRNQFNQRSDFFSGGSYNFASLDDFIRSTVNTFSTTSPGSDNNRGWRMNLVGMYLQDDVSVRPGLTINLGLRYEFITTPREVNGKVAQIRRLDEAHFYSVTPKQTDVGDPFYLNPSLRNFAPRVGVAWTPFSSGKTAVRAGAGVFHEQLTQGLFQTGGVRLPPFYSAAVLSAATLPQGCPEIAFPDVYQTQAQTLASCGGKPQGDGFQWNPDQPTVYKFNLSIQQQLLADTTLEVGYAGTRGVHNTRGNMLLNTTPVNEVPELRGRFIFIEQPLPNSEWDRMRWRMTDGTSWYNALLISLSKRFSRGFQVQSSYTFSKSMDDSSTFSGSSDFGGLDTLGVRREHWKGRSAFDVTQSWSTSFQYDLPGRNLSGIAGKILGGWNIGGLLRAFSGNPVTPSATRSALNRLATGALTGNGGTSTCTAAQRANPGCATNTITYVAGPSVNLAPGVEKVEINPGSRTNYFNPADFAWPATFQNGTAPLNYPGAGRNGAPGGLVAIGNVGRNIFTVPGNFNLDLSLRKDTAMPVLGEEGRMEFRFEMFNAPNHTRLGLPGTALFNNRGEPNVNAGIITDSRGNSRQIQLSLRMVF